MNPFGWKKWKEVPYRGDGSAKNFKSRRRYVNLKKQRRDLAASTLIILVIFGCVFGSILLKDTSRNETNSTNMVGFVIGAIFFLMLIAGIFSFTKFRKGYDVDISDDSDDDDEEPNESTKLMD